MKASVWENLFMKMWWSSLYLKCPHDQWLFILCYLIWVLLQISLNCSNLASISGQSGLIVNLFFICLCKDMMLMLLEWGTDGLTTGSFIDGRCGMIIEAWTYFDALHRDSLLFSVFSWLLSIVTLFGIDSDSLCPALSSTEWDTGAKLSMVIQIYLNCCTIMRLILEAWFGNDQFKCKANHCLESTNLLWYHFTFLVKFVKNWKNSRKLDNIWSGCLPPLS